MQREAGVSVVWGPKVGHAVRTQVLANEMRVEKRVHARQQRQNFVGMVRMGDVVCEPILKPPNIASHSVGDV